MTVKARIVAIRLTKKIEQRPEYASQIGLSARYHKAKRKNLQQKKGQIELL